MALINKLSAIGDAIRTKRNITNKLNLAEMPAQILAIETGNAYLNYAVVGGTTAPTNPVENTIWVNTDTAISGYAFDVNEPTVADNLVWIKLGEASLVPFSAIKNKTVMMFPLSVEQYINGAWVAKEAQVYQDGGWKSMKLQKVYLFNGGDTDVTGGWTFTSGDTKVSSYSIGTTIKFTCNPCDSSTINYTARLYTNNVITNNGFSKLYINYKTAYAYRGNASNPALWVKDANNSAFEVNWADLNETNYVQQIDISNVSSFKLEFGSHPWYKGSLNSGCNIEVSAIWME